MFTKKELVINMKNDLFFKEIMKTMNFFNMKTGTLIFWDKPENEIIDFLYEKKCFCCSSDKMSWELDNKILKEFKNYINKCNLNESYIQLVDKKLKKLNSGSWEDCAYFYDEICDQCGYNSIDYANFFNISLNDFNKLDDYDGFRWKIDENDKCYCEVCYKTNLIDEKLKKFPKIKYEKNIDNFNNPSVVQIYIEHNSKNRNIIDEIIGEHNYHVSKDWIVFGLDYEELIDCEFLETINDQIYNNINSEELTNKR